MQTRTPILIAALAAGLAAWALTALKTVPPPAPSARKQEEDVQPWFV